MKPLISVIIPTKNSANTLKFCLTSLKNQTYKSFEVIIVDNSSTDTTKQISKQYKAIVYDRGPERAAQKNYGAFRSQGKYIFFIDSDMELEKNVLSDCILKISQFDALIIPEKSVGEGFWNKCVILERRCYVGDIDMEACRFFKAKVFRSLHGFDESLVASGEDMDLSQRARRLKLRIGRINSFIIHHEGSRTLMGTINKWRYYGKNMGKYYSKNPKEAALQYLPIRRGWIKNWKILVLDPVHTAGFILLKTCNFVGVTLGQIETIFSRQDEKYSPYK